MSDSHEDDDLELGDFFDEEINEAFAASAAAAAANSANNAQAPPLDDDAFYQFPVPLADVEDGRGGSSKKQNGIPQTPEEFVERGMLPPGMDVDEYLARISPIFAMRDANHLARDAILCRHQVGTPEYEQEITAHTRRSFDEAITAFFESDKMPNSYKTARKQFADQQNQFVDIPLFYDNGSYFENCIQLWYDRIDTMRGLGDFVATFIVVQLAALSIFSLSDAKRVHVALLGEASTGKSHLLKTLLMTMPKGTANQIMHSTALANTVGGVVDVAVKIYEELKASQVGMDKFEMNSQAATVWKNSLTQAYVGTDSILCADGVRMQCVYGSYMCHAVAGAYNGSAPTANNPTAQRFVKIHMGHRNANDEGAIIKRMFNATDDRLAAFVKGTAHIERTVNFYHMLVDYLIFLGVFFDVEETGSKLYVERINEGMASRGFVLADPKKLAQLQQFIRILTIRHAVEQVLCGPMATERRRLARDHESKTFIGYEWSWLKDIQRHLVATREITVFACTLLRSTWGSPIVSTLLTAAKELTVGDSIEFFDDSCFVDEKSRLSLYEEVRRKRERAKRRLNGTLAAAARRATAAAKRAAATERVAEATRVAAAQGGLAEIDEETARLAQEAIDYQADTEASEIEAPVHEPAAQEVAYSSELPFRLMTTYSLDRNENLVAKVYPAYAELTSAEDLGIVSVAKRLAAMAASMGMIPSVDNIAQGLQDLAAMNLVVPELALSDEGVLYGTGEFINIPMARIVRNNGLFDPKKSSGNGLRVFISVAAMLGSGGLDEAMESSVRTMLSFPQAVPARIVSATPRRVNNLRTTSGTVLTERLLSTITVEPGNRPWIHRSAQVFTQRILSAMSAHDPNKRGVLSTYRPEPLRAVGAMVIAMEPEWRSATDHALRIGDPEPLACHGTTMRDNADLRQFIEARANLKVQQRIDYAEHTEREVVADSSRSMLLHAASKDPTAQSYFPTSTDSALGGAANVAPVDNSMIRLFASVNRAGALSLLHSTIDVDRKRTKRRREDADEKEREINEITSTDFDVSKDNLHELQVRALPRPAPAVQAAAVSDDFIDLSQDDADDALGGGAGSTSASIVDLTIGDSESRLEHALADPNGDLALTLERCRNIVAVDEVVVASDLSHLKSKSMSVAANGELISDILAEEEAAQKQLAKRQRSADPAAAPSLTDDELCAHLEHIEGIRSQGADIDRRLAKSTPQTVEVLPLPIAMRRA